jgi:hypothetical protein
MSFIDSIDEKIVKGLVLKCREKKTGKIYPVRKIDFSNEDGFDVCYLTEEDQVEEHIAKGGHYCSSCGQVFYDEHFSFDEIELILEKIVVE